VTRPNPNNLPPQSSTFVGRAGELDRLDHLVRGHRLVTIVGLGGIGKTRLALQGARAAIGSYPNGVWFVSLKEIDEPSRIANAAAEAVGLEADDESMQGRLFEHLWKARALLVFDNAEHLVAGVAAFTRDLLEAAPEVRVVVTSREALHVEGEQVLWLGAIDDGVRLFMDRAYGTEPPAQLPLQVTNAVANICAKLQGIPLAIELAAARAIALPPEELIGTIDRLPLNDAILGHMVEWSYRLLEVSERQCFDAIALFEASFSWEAAEAIASPGDENIVALLDSLVKKSLVAAVKTNESTEYYLLEVVREYARQHLTSTVSGAPDYARRYVDYYLNYVERLTSTGIDQVRMLAGLNKEWANLQGALRLAMDQQFDRERACGTIASLWRLWAGTGRAREGLYWIERALKIQGLPEREHIELLDAAARMALSSQNFAEVEFLSAQLVDARERAGDSKALGDALAMLASAKHSLLADEEAKPLYRRALEQYEKSGSRRGVAVVLGALGTVIEQQTVSDPEKFDEARDLLEQSLTIFREEAAIFSCAQMLENLGVLCMRSGDLETALAYTKESLATYRQIKNDDRASVAHVSIADVHLAAGEPLRAISELQAGRRVLGDRPQGPFVLHYTESAWKAAVDLAAYEAAAKLYAFAGGYRKIIGRPLQPGEQAARTSHYTALQEALDASALERLFGEGARMDIPAVDALIAELKHSNVRAAAKRTPKSFETPAVYVPDARRPMLQRERLSQRIDESAEYPVVFVTARGGWGKSIAIDQYFAAEGRTALRLKLGPNATTLEEFIEVFRLAVARSLPKDDNLRNAAAKPAADLLLDWLAPYRGAVLVDDLHFADDDPRIAQLLFDVIGRTTSHVRWFLLSRRSGQAPIGSCIAAGLTRQPIDERDLAFTIDDTMEYARLLRTSATQPECEAIVGFTDGWPLAVNLAMQAQLAAVAMAPLERRPQVERETVSLASFYLRETVFQPLAPKERRLLLAASAMPGDIRIAVVRQLDRAAERTLARLSTIVPMRRAADSAYALSQLFKRYLRSELEKSPEAETIRRTVAEAFERIGDPISQVKVLLDMEQYEAIVRVLSEQTQTLANADWPDLLETVVARLPARSLESDATVLMARAAIAERYGRFDLAMQLFERAATNAAPQLRLRIACAQAAFFINNGLTASAAPLKLAIDHSRDEPVMELRARALLCHAYVDEQRTEEAAQLLRKIAPAVGELVIDESNVDVPYWIALAYHRLEDDAAAKRLASRVVLSGSPGDAWLVLAQANDLLSQIAARSGAPFDEVLRYADAASATAQQLGSTRYYTACLQRRCVLLFYSGNVELIKTAMNRSDTSRTPLWSTYSTVFRFLAELQQAASAETTEKATTSYAAAFLVAKALPADPVLARDPFIPEACVIVTGCLANDQTIKTAVEQNADAPAATRRHAEIARLTAVLCQVFLGQHLPLAQLTASLEKPANDVVADGVASIVRDIVYAVRTKRPLPKALAKALEELDGRGYGTVSTLLAGLARRAASVVATGVALSKAEREILLQMAESLSAAEIAAARHISIDTVRTHMKNLYRKLDVNGATAAINRARSLGLL
jgi:predicted ATPase/ATP/maltotriose-dependent transcriptional regulator MalT